MNNSNSGVQRESLTKAEIRREKMKIYRRTYLDKHPDKRKESSARYYAANKDACRKYSRGWSAANPVKVKERKLRFAEANPDAARKYHSSYKDRNPDGLRNWHKANPGARGVYTNTRRALVVGAGGSHTASEWKNLKKLYDYTCLCCGRKESDIKLTVDHVVPISKGGRNTVDNLQPLCGSCNSSKGTKTMDYRHQLSEAA